MNGTAEVIECERRTFATRKDVVDDPSFDVKVDRKMAVRSPLGKETGPAISWTDNIFRFSGCGHAEAPIVTLDVTRERRFTRAEDLEQFIAAATLAHQWMVKLSEPSERANVQTFVRTQRSNEKTFWRENFEDANDAALQGAKSFDVVYE